MNASRDEKTMALQDQAKKLQSQKDTLLKELDSIEEKFERTNRLYKKYLPVIIDTLATDDTRFSKICRDLSKAFKKEESQGKIEYICEQLKTAMLKEDIHTGAGKKKKGLFSSLLKNESESFIDLYKESYHEVVSHLRGSLDKKFSKQLDDISIQVKNAQNTTDISDIRENVFGLVFNYISDTNEDRAKVNAFVRDVVGKILDIESRFTSTVEQTENMVENNDGFESALGIELAGLKQTSDVAKSLDELKIKVTQRLSAIEKALAEKQAKDSAIKETAKKNRQMLKTGFAKLKQELDKATRYTEELEEKLNRDQLTGAYNRRAYDQRIELEMDRFLRYKTGFSLMVIDADKFKNINDRYGHAIGDRCLQEIIKRSIPLLRKNDMLARYGGEEFVVIMPETDSEGAKNAAEKIRQTIEKIEFLYKKEKVKVTVSIGISQAKPEDTDHRQIFERADIAVYKAKEQGRNRVLVVN